MNGKMQLIIGAICTLIFPINCYGYLSTSLKESYLSDALLRDIVDHMGRDLVDAADSYIDPIPNELPSRLALMSRAAKDLEVEQMDYDSLLDGGNPNHPSLRDQEYMQHSTLWGHQYGGGGGGIGSGGVGISSGGVGNSDVTELGTGVGINGNGGIDATAVVGGPSRHIQQQQQQQQQQIKTDTTLPAYCNPPNPCPVGYNEENGCQMNFENTASFSRDYQAAQECMCDGEHMFDCPGQDQQDTGRQMNSDLESYLARQFHTSEHKNLVAKKFQPISMANNFNPYLAGEKLPIAAKKGNHAY